MTTILVAIFVALLLAGGYTLLVYRYRPNDLWAWGHSAVSMLASTLLAVSGALMVFYFQQQEVDADNRQKQMHLVALELAQLRSDLLSDSRVNVTVDGRKFAVHLFQFEPLALEQAARSGLFSEGQNWQLNVLSQSVRNWNFKASLAVASLNAPTTDYGRSERLEWIVANIDRSRQGLLKGIDLLAQKLNVEIPKTGVPY